MGAPSHTLNTLNETRRTGLPAATNHPICVADLPSLHTRSNVWSGPAINTCGCEGGAPPPPVIRAGHSSQAHLGGKAGRGAVYCHPRLRRCCRWMVCGSFLPLMQSRPEHGREWILLVHGCGAALAALWPAWRRMRV